jgi:biotin carboxyl carrier protein
MKNLLLNELNRMKYLTNHERGVVISEQKIVLKEQEEPTFDDLLWNLQNDRLKDFKFDIGRSNLTTGNTSYVAVEHKRDLLFLQKKPQTVFKYKKGESSNVGTWKWVIDLESTSKWKYKLVIVPTNTITTDATTATNTTKSNSEIQSEKLLRPISKDQISSEEVKILHNESMLVFTSKKPSDEHQILAVQTGEVGGVFNNLLRISSPNGINIYIYYPEFAKINVKSGDQVKKGDVIGVIPSNPNRTELKLGVVDRDKTIEIGRFE